MELQFTPGKYITLKETYEHAQHIVVDKNNVFKTNVYYEYYNENELNQRIHDLTVKYNFVFDKVESNDKAVILTRSDNRDYVKIFCDKDVNGNNWYELYLIEPDMMKALKI